LHAPGGSLTLIRATKSEYSVPRHYLAERDKPQVEICCIVGLPKQSNNHAAQSIGTRDTPPLKIAALDANHFAQQFAAGNWRIIVPQPVAARNQKRLALILEGPLCAAVHAHHAMREHSSFAREQHSLSN
jgi:hypothetical protein